MANSWLVLPEEGGGGGSGYITSVSNTSTISLAVVGGNLTATAIASGIRAMFSAVAPLVYNSATGQFSITQSDATTDGYLSSTDWNTFNNKADPFTGGSVSFVFTDGAGALDTLTGWEYNSTEGMQVGQTYLATNAGGINQHTMNMSVQPTISSPNAFLNYLNYTVDLDTVSSGFDFGTAGNAVRVLNTSITHQGTGNVGQIGLLEQSYSLGNGTDPFTVNGISYAYGFGNINASVTLDGPLQGYGFQPTVDAAAILTGNTNIRAFYDFASIASASTVPNYSSAIFGPNVTSVTNFNYVQMNGTFGTVSAFSCLNITPNITTSVSNFWYSQASGALNACGNFTGYQVNPTFTGSLTSGTAINAGGTVQTGVTGVNYISYNDSIQWQSGSGAANYTGINESPGFLTGSTVVDYKGVQINPNYQAGVTSTSFSGLIVDPGGSPLLTSCTGINVNLSNVTLVGGGTPTGFNMNGAAFQTGVTFVPPSAATVFSGNNIGANVSVLAGSPLTGTDTIAQNMATTFIFEDDVANGPIGIGQNGIGYVGQLVVFSGKTVDQVNFAIAGAQIPVVVGDGGNITDVHLYNATGLLNGGGATTVTNLVGFYAPTLLESTGIATNVWGVRIDADVNNWFNKAVVVGGSTMLPTNSSVGIEIGGTTKALLNSSLTTTEVNALTAVNGMQTYDSDIDKMKFRENAAWVTYLTGLTYLLPNNTTNASYVADWSPESAFATAADLQSSSADFEGTNAFHFTVSLSTGEALLCFANFASASISAISDPSGIFLLADAGTGIYISKSASDNTITVKNRMGGSRGIGIQPIGARLTGVTVWA